MIDLKKAKTADLEAELQLYRDAGVDDVAESKDLGNNKDRVAEINRLSAVHGFPALVDADFIKENPELASHLMGGDENNAKEGDIVFVEQADLDQVAEAEAMQDLRNELDTLGIAWTPENTFDELSALKIKGPEDKGNQGSKNNVEASDVDLVYLQKTVNKTVTSVRDTIVSGKTYKDVSVASGETFRLSREEFTRDVNPRV